jgi:hypothetical protein
VDDVVVWAVFVEEADFEEVCDVFGGGSVDFVADVVGDFWAGLVGGVAEDSHPCPASLVGAEREDFAVAGEAVVYA